MEYSLRQAEIEQLKEFRYSDQKYMSELSIPVMDLLRDNKMEQYLEKIRKKISAPDMRVTASMFMKRYGFFAVLNLYAMTILNKRLNTSLSNLSLETNDEDQELWYWNPKFHLSEKDSVPAPTSSREAWREESIKSIFHDHIHEILIELATRTKVSKKVLWEDIAIYIFWLYESLLANPKYEDKKSIIKEDFEYIIKKAEGHLFGPLSFNPLTRFYGKKVYRGEYDQEIRMRTTCCLYYKTSQSGDRCKTCPISCAK